MLENYSFEVFWKDEKTAHVQVENETVNVERFTEHPLKQLFAEEKMSRYQLNRILELRCWDRGRPDTDEILKYLGLTAYIPYEIIRKTHGVSYNDFIWFRFPGEQISSRDVLVRESLTPLWETPMENRTLAAVKGAVNLTEKWEWNSGRSYWHQLSEMKGGYINAGVYASSSCRGEKKRAGRALA